MSRICPMCKRKMTDPKRIKFYTKTYGMYYCRFCGYDKELPPTNLKGDRSANQKLKRANPGNLN